MIADGKILLVSNMYPICFAVNQKSDDGPNERLVIIPIDVTCSLNKLR